MHATATAQGDGCRRPPETAASSFGCGVSAHARDEGRVQSGAPGWTQLWLSRGRGWPPRGVASWVSPLTLLSDLKENVRKSNKEAKVK